MRFTQRNSDLFALVLGWPEGGVARIATLATSSPHVAGATIGASSSSAPGLSNSPVTRQG